MPDRRPQPMRVWLADLDRLEAALEAVEATAGLLACTERKWMSPAPAGARRRRRLARIALRLVLVRQGAEAARGVELAVDAHGKPRLATDGLAFNASHSGGLALIAVASHGPIGVDLETERRVQLGPERRALIVAAGSALCATGCGPGGSITVLAAEGTSDTATFLAAWTRLEAFAKARGTGIGTLLTDLGITASGARVSTPYDVGARAHALSDATQLAVASLALLSGTYGAVAAPREHLREVSRVEHLDPADCRLET